MTIWITGLAGSGKTTIGKVLCTHLKKEKPNTVFLDGDLLRDVIGDNTGFSRGERLAKSKQYSRFCRMLSDQGLNIICCAVAMHHEVREWNRKNLIEYYEVFIDTPLEILIKRDKNGLYSGALNGEVTDVMGINSEYERPKNPDLTLLNDGDETPEIAARGILKLIDLG